MHQHGGDDVRWKPPILLFDYYLLVYESSLIYDKNIFISFVVSYMCNNKQFEN